MSAAVPGGNDREFLQTDESVIIQGSRGTAAEAGEEFLEDAFGSDEAEAGDNGQTSSSGSITAPTSGAPQSGAMNSGGGGFGGAFTGSFSGGNFVPFPVSRPPAPVQGIITIIDLN